VNPAGTKSRSRFSGLWAVFLLSALSMAVVGLMSGPLRTWETASADLLMRWRYTVHGWTSTPQTLVNEDITLLSIDADTQRILGRFPAGPWLSREPFLQQLGFFEEYFRPTVVAYDIVFQDPLGVSGHAGQRVSESTETLQRIVDEMKKVVENPAESVSGRILPGLNRFAAEQGNSILANCFASTRENGRFTCVLGCLFLGGAVDPRPTVALWSNEDVVGDDPTGNEESGKRIPYVKDMTIPARDIHFSSPEAEQKYDYSPNALLPSQELLDYALLGFLNGPRDADYVVRQLPMVIGFRYFNAAKREEKRAFVPSFSLATALLHLGVSFPLQEGVVRVDFGRQITVRSPRGVYRIPIDETGRLYLNFNAKLEDFNPVSFARVAPVVGLSKDYRAQLARTYRKDVDGHVVLVAVTTSAQDAGNCPLAPNTAMVVVHLTALNNILNRCFLVPLTRGGALMLFAALFAVFTTICCLERTARVGPASLLFALLYGVVCYAGVHMNRYLLPLVGPLVYVGLCSFSVMSYRFFVEERAKRKIRGMFSTMVSGKVLTFLEENPESFSLKGRNVDATVFFSDVASFTRISERLPPERLTQFLNAYLTPVTNCIMEYGGYVDKYVGDGVMAVWGAPFPDPQHAEKACLCALEQQRIIRDLGSALKAEYDVELQVRMGIASGIVTAGNMGSEKKFQFTVIGDVVNLASRLEPANKDFGTRIIISESTRQMARNAIVTRPLAKIRVMGKKEVVDIHELVGETGRVDQAVLDGIEVHRQALERFYNRDWAGCLDLLDRLPVGSEDGATSFLKRWALACRQKSPSDEWQGEYIRAEKT